MSNIEYNNLLFGISAKIDVNELPRLVFMCREKISKGSKANIQDVLTLFEELEKQNHLGIDRLDILKELLTQIKKRPLLRKVEEFEIRRKAQSVGIVSSLKRAAACLKGAVKLVCNFRTIAGSLVVVGSTLALHSCSSLEEYIDVFNKVVLVASSKLVEISEGSLCFTVQADTPSVLKELWDIYKNGTLQNRLQKFLVTEEIKQLASGEDIEVTVYIDEQEYKQAYLDLMLLENQVSVPDDKEEEQPGVRCRRNSDSFLCFKPNEVEVASMKLKHAENKWNFERQIHAEEVMKLKKDTAEAGNKSDNSRELCLKDLSHEVVSQLRRRLESDQVATIHICQSFGITGTPYNRRIDIFKLFPETPVKMLKDVFEALQLYDLVDLLEEEKPQKPQHRSLRIALPLQEVEKLKKGADRPTTYHSSAAVLIIGFKENSLHREGIRDFFKGLNAKSNITVIQYRSLFDEVESVKSAASAVIDRWIHNQGNFSLFAVFGPSQIMFGDRWVDGIIKRLVSGIPDKIKFVIMPHLQMEPRELPETLLVVVPFRVDEIVLGLMLEILNKRWRKLDLISMMEEFKRSLYDKYQKSLKTLFGMHRGRGTSIIDDQLTSLPRFKKEEDITD